MPTFKPKSSKKIQVCAKSTTTLDSKHRSIVEEMTVTVSNEKGLDSLIIKVFFLHEDSD